MSLFEQIKEIKDGRIITFDGGIGSGVKGHQMNQATGTKEEQNRLIVLERNRQAALRSGDPQGAKECQEEIDDLNKKINRETKDCRFFSPDEIKSIGETVGVDFSKIDLKQFAKGLQVEQEHSDLTNGDPAMTAKIVMAHLREIPDYYTRLEKMETSIKTGDTWSEEARRKAIESRKAHAKNKIKGKQGHINSGERPQVQKMKHGDIVAFNKPVNEEEKGARFILEGEPNIMGKVKIRLIKNGKPSSFSEYVHESEIKTSDGGPGSGKKGHVTPVSRNFARGLASHFKKTSAAASRFPIGSMVRENRQGARLSRVIGHSGNVIHTTGGDLHVTKATKDGGPGSGKKGHVTAENKEIRVKAAHQAAQTQFLKSLSPEMQRRFLSLRFDVRVARFSKSERAKSIAKNKLEKFMAELPSNKQVQARKFADGGPGSGKKGHRTLQERRNRRNYLIDKILKKASHSQKLKSFHELEKMKGKDFPVSEKKNGV